MSDNRTNSKNRYAARLFPANNLYHQPLLNFNILMQKLLIPIFAVIFVASAFESSAQTPQQIGLPAEPIKYTT
ncbi:MAG: hypothetical protein ACKOCH_13575, partial [Bacteroidota bacterium]